MHVVGMCHPLIDKQVSFGAGLTQFDVGTDSVAQEQVTGSRHQQRRREPVEVTVDRGDTRIGKIKVAGIEPHRRIDKPVQRG